MLLTQCDFFAQYSECQNVENFKQARANGSHVGLKPVLFVTQPKLRIMCFHVLRQLHQCCHGFDGSVCVCGKVLCLCLCSR